MVGGNSCRRPDRCLPPSKFHLLPIDFQLTAKHVIWPEYRGFNRGRGVFLTYPGIGTRIAIQLLQRLKLESNMPITIDSALGIHPQALTLRSQRAEVLAANLANADTPNYKARDIDFKSVLSATQNTTTAGAALPMAASNAAHIQPLASQSSAELLYRNPRQPSVDGNTVDSQVEYTEFARNALQYQSSLTFLSGKIKTLLTAIRGD